MPDEAVAPATLQDSGTPTPAASAALAVPAPDAVVESPLLTGVEAKETPKDRAEVPADNKEAKAEPVVLPEKYELKVPEGVTIDAEMLELFDPVARKLGLDQNTAQEVADLYAGIRQLEAKKAETAWNDQVVAWRKTTEKDPEIGGPKLSESLKAADAFLSRYGGADVVKDLARMGLANYPPLVKLLVKAGMSMSEASMVPAGQPSRPRDIAAVLFPDNPPR